MKRIKLLAIMALCVVLSCRKEDPNSMTVSQGNTANAGPGAGKKSLAGMLRMDSNGPFSQFIPIDSANKMINSYLASINVAQNDSDLQSLIFNADSLRNYLNNNPGIKQVKFMFAHTLEYVNAGNYGVRCGYQTGELTLIVAGFDANNVYVYSPGATVLDHAQPCPSICPSTGNASLPTLQ